MNFLAHMSLSSHDEDQLIGNFIADAVKSSQWSDFNPEIVRGIQLHHRIDEFTDEHPIVKRSKQRLRSTQGKYAPVVVDILYDHFLSRYYEDYHELPVEDFAGKVYRLLSERHDELPKAIQYMLPHMMRNDWLVAYGQKEGLENVFRGMSRRANFPNNMDTAVDDLFRDYEAFEEDFRTFYPALQSFVSDELGDGTVKSGGG